LHPVEGGRGIGGNRENVRGKVLVRERKRGDKKGRERKRASHKL